MIKENKDPVEYVPNHNIRNQKVLGCAGREEPVVEIGQIELIN